MNEVPLGNVVYSDFIELVVKHDARPERPDDEEAPTLSDAIWEVAEKCWVKDPRKRPTASATCDIVSRLLGTNVPPTSSNPELPTHTPCPRRVPPTTLPGELSVRAAPSSNQELHTARPRHAPHTTPSPGMMRTARLPSSVGEVEHTRRGDFLVLPSQHPSSSSTAVPQGEMKEVLVLGSKLELRGHTDYVYGIAFSHDGRRIVSGFFDGTIRVWDVETGYLILGPLTQAGDGYFTSVTFSPDGTQIASGSNSGEVTIWDAHTGKTYAGALKGQTKWVYFVVFSPDGKLVASSSGAKVVVWETLSGRKILDQAGSYVCPTFSPDGKRLLWKRGRSITVWDVRAARDALEFPGDDSIAYLAFSADGTRIISGDVNGDFRTWDAVTGAAIATVPSKKHRVGTLAVAYSSKKKYRVDISPDGKWIARRCESACGDDHKHGVEIWNSATGELASTIESSSVYYLTFSPDRKRPQIAYTHLVYELSCELYPHPNSRCRHIIAVAHTSLL